MKKDALMSVTFTAASPGIIDDEANDFFGENENIKIIKSNFQVVKEDDGSPTFYLNIIYTFGIDLLGR